MDGDHMILGALPLTDFSVRLTTLSCQPWVDILTSATLPQVHRNYQSLLELQDASVHDELLSLFGRWLHSSLGSTFVDPKVHRRSPLSTDNC
jgi:hypothetical protein